MSLTGRSVHVSGDDGALARALGARGATIVDGDGPVDAVVHVVTDPDALAERPVASMAVDEWNRRCDAVLKRAIDAAQDAYRRMSARGGRLVFVVPSLGLTGAAGLAPLAAAAEGVRSMSKTAARQWGKHGITTACLARRVAGPVVAISSLDEPTGDDIADTVALLVTDQLRAATGATIVLDGGTVLVP
jgi:NAD(P)-dependent dehydrogenase (short-subunit alcohol dehydrogenase family)